MSVVLGPFRKRCVLSKAVETGVGQGKAKLLISILLVAATLVVYEPVRHNEFVNCDDYTFLMSNRHVRDGLSWESLRWAFTDTTISGNWHPLTWLSHMADTELFGTAPAGPHYVNVGLHTLNVLLLFGFLLYTTRRIWPGATVAAFFAMHPLHVESVAWAAERKDVLSSFFWLATMLAWAWYAGRPGRSRYLLVIVLFALGLMAKSMLVTLPFVLLLLDYWPLERFRWRRGSGGTDSGKVWVGRLVLEKTPLFLMSAGLAVITLVAQKDAGAVSTLEIVPVGYRIGNMFVSYIAYIRKMIWPMDLAVMYPLNAMDRAAVALAPLFAVLLAVATIGAFYIGRRRKYVLVGWLWYIGTLVPVIGLVQVGSQAMADRYMYMPMVGLLVIAAWALGDLASGRQRRHAVIGVIVVAILFAMVLLSRKQVTYWRNSETLFGHALRTVGSSPLVEGGYGYALFEAGRVDEAVVHLRKAVSMNPNFFDARNNLGKVLLSQGKADKAIACFDELIEVGHDPADVYYSLGMALGMQSRYEQAARCFEAALAKETDYPSARKRMGIALLAAGKSVEAAVQLEQALLAAPEDAEIHMNLGMAHARSGRPDLAEENWARAIDAEPNNPSILNNIAWTLATTGEARSAEAARAVALAQRACELTEYTKPAYLDTLAASYAAAGRFPEAVETAEKALSTAEAAEQAELAAGIRERLKLYQEGRRAN